MNALPVRVEDRRFAEWRHKVAVLVEARLGLTLAELPELPLEAGYDAGDSAAEFYAGCVVEHAAEQSLDAATAGLGGHVPSWPPPG